MGQPLAAVGAITITMTICSATASFFAGAIAKRMGTGAVVATSCLMTALALLGFSVAPLSVGWLHWQFPWAWVRVLWTPA